MSKARNSLACMQVRPTTVCDEHTLHRHNRNKVQFFLNILPIIQYIKGRISHNPKSVPKNAYPSVVVLESKIIFNI